MCALLNCLEGEGISGESAKDDDRQVRTVSRDPPKTFDASAVGKVQVEESSVKGCVARGGVIDGCDGLGNGLDLMALNVQWGSLQVNLDQFCIAGAIFNEQKTEETIHKNGHEVLRNVQGESQSVVGPLQ